MKGRMANIAQVNECDGKLIWIKKMETETVCVNNMRKFGRAITMKRNEDNKEEVWKWTKGITYIWRDGDGVEDVVWIDVGVVPVISI